MGQQVWRLPGWALAVAFVAWIFLAGQLAAVVPGERGQSLASATMVLPFFLWLAACSSRLGPTGRFYLGGLTGWLLLAVWLPYCFVVVPFLQDDPGQVAGSEQLGLIVNLLFVVAVVVGYDRVVSALVGGEAQAGRAGTGYALTLLALLFPPIALWLIHPRVAALPVEASGV